MYPASNSHAGGRARSPCRPVAHGPGGAVTDNFVDADAGMVGRCTSLPRLACR